MSEFITPEQGEKPTKQPAYYVFLGRHAERDDYSEISSLSLTGIYEAHDVGGELIRKIAQELPEGAIKLELLNAKAYRTQETVEIIAQEIRTEAQKIGKQLEISEPQLEERFLEKRDELPVESVKSIENLLSDIRQRASMNEAPLVVIGVLHEERLRNFLSNTLDKKIDEVNPAEFAEITGSRETQKISFRDQEIQQDVRLS